MHTNSEQSVEGWELLLSAMANKFDIKNSLIYGRGSAEFFFHVLNAENKEGVLFHWVESKYKNIEPDCHC
jgi:hypothetical protein